MLGFVDVDWAVGVWEEICSVDYGMTETGVPSGALEKKIWAISIGRRMQPWESG